MSTKKPTIPGVPSSGTPTVAEPTKPIEPLPPKPDQAAPEQRTATGRPIQGPESARSQQGDYLTTAQGARLYDTDHSLKAGERGPTLLQDHHLREKITHFDHERIPERVVHARGAGAHGVFRGYGTAGKISKAAFLGKDVETPVFVRFSVVVGARGCGDAIRDTRGFATKFYTPEGVFDLVGNNIPVFFIQDGIKFPDIIHAVKPGPDREIPQGQSAHDTFWDFVSLHTEATAHTIWHISDRGIPRSYRMMEGFGVHTFRLVDADDNTTLVKFHWKPRLGVHSLVWEEAQLVNGFDPDFHRRDLADAIESGAYPEWELGVQVFPDTPEQMFEGIDLLDPTKFVPEELAPVHPIGLMTLNANPTNYFAETEQVAFHPGHLVPGIDLTDDPLLQARLFSYLDTQLLRLGGPNFAQLPINRPHAPINDMFRDGMHQSGIHTGVAPYHPNSLDGGCPFLAGLETGAYIEAPTEMPASVKVRAASATFDDHYTQVRLFYHSLTQIERDHIIAAYTFELGKCYEKAIKERTLQVLANIDPNLCAQVSAGLGLPAPDATVDYGATPARSPALSQVGSEWPLDGRIIGIVADENADLAQVSQLIEAIGGAAMVPLVIGPHGGQLSSDNVGTDNAVTLSRTFDTMRSVEYDAVLFASTPPDSRLRILVDETFRHCKPIGALVAGRDLLATAGVAADAPGIVIADDATSLFNRVQPLLKAHRVWDRAAML